MTNRILVVLSYIGMALVFGAVAVRLLGWMGAVSVTPEIDRYVIIAVLAGLALVVIYTLGQWREIGAYFGQRNAQNGVLATASVAICLGILVAVNYLSERHNTRWDLTENQQHSLSDQTVQILRGLETPVRVLVFERELDMAPFRARLTKYQYHSNRIEVEYIDPERQPLLAQEHDIQFYGTVVLEHMGRTERVTSSAEHDLTNAIITLLDPQERTLYFLAGHGERSLLDTDRLGLSGLADALRRSNYAFDTLVLAQAGAIPDDATVVVTAGPRSDLLDQETAVLRAYLDAGGALLALVDPPDDLARPTPQPNLMGLLREWGVDATESVIVDVSGLTAVATIPVVAPPYPPHPITERFSLLTLFPLARAIVPAGDAPDGRFARTFAETSPRSWAETALADLMNEGVPAFDPDTGDIPGPVAIGVTVSVPVPGAADVSGADDLDETEPQPRETRVAVLGDSDFATNAYLGQQGNSDFLLNTVSWLAQQENLISIRPRDPSDRRIDLTPRQIDFVRILSLLLVPGAVAGAGFYTWWRRRSR